MQEETHLIGEDQYGNEWGPLDPKRPKASLLEEMCRTSAVPMYCDTRTGTVQVGYVVAPERGTDESAHWVTLMEVTVRPWRKER
jgi:hypothetical protein